MFDGYSTQTCSVLAVYTEVKTLVKRNNFTWINLVRAKIYYKKLSTEITKNMITSFMPVKSASK
jgi:hypothetical protein